MTSLNICFSNLELAVKLEHKMCNEYTIASYVYAGLERAKLCSCTTQTRKAHLRIFDTLLETVCDDCLSLEWRNTCYSWIKKLSPLLFEIFPKEVYSKKVAEAKLMKAYFLEQNTKDLTQQK